MKEVVLRQGEGKELKKKKISDRLVISSTFCNIKEVQRFRMEQLQDTSSNKSSVPVN